MADYDNTNRGALFKNTEKDSDNHPDYKGNLNVNGTDHWISAWLKTSKDGKKYMSLSITAKDAAKGSSKSKKQDDDESDIPF